MANQNEEMIGLWAAQVPMRLLASPEEVGRPWRSSLGTRVHTYGRHPASGRRLGTESVVMQHRYTIVRPLRKPMFLLWRFRSSGWATAQPAIFSDIGQAQRRRPHATLKGASFGPLPANRAFRMKQTEH